MENSNFGEKKMKRQLFSILIAALIISCGGETSRPGGKSNFSASITGKSALIGSSITLYDSKGAEVKGLTSEKVAENGDFKVDGIKTMETFTLKTCGGKFLTKDGQDFGGCFEETVEIKDKSVTDVVVDAASTLEQFTATGEVLKYIDAEDIAPIEQTTLTDSMKRWLFNKAFEQLSKTSAEDLFNSVLTEIKDDNKINASTTAKMPGTEEKINFNMFRNSGDKSLVYYMNESPAKTTEWIDHLNTVPVSFLSDINSDVDTIKPELTIKTDSIVYGTFTLQANATDTNLKNISCSLIFPKTAEAEIKTIVLEDLNDKTETFENDIDTTVYPDGKFSIECIATDTYANATTIKKEILIANNNPVEIAAYMPEPLQNYSVKIYTFDEMKFVKEFVISEDSEEKLLLYPGLYYFELSGGTYKAALSETTLTLTAKMYAVADIKPTTGAKIIFTPITSLQALYAKNKGSIDAGKNAFNKHFYPNVFDINTVPTADLSNITNPSTISYIVLAGLEQLAQNISIQLSSIANKYSVSTLLDLFYKDIADGFFDAKNNSNIITIDSNNITDQLFRYEYAVAVSNYIDNLKIENTVIDEILSAISCDSSTELFNTPGKCFVPAELSITDIQFKTTDNYDIYNETNYPYIKKGGFFNLSFSLNNIDIDQVPIATEIVSEYFISEKIGCTETPDYQNNKTSFTCEYKMMLNEIATPELSEFAFKIEASDAADNKASSLDLKATTDFETPSLTVNIPEKGCFIQDTITYCKEIIPFEFEASDNKNLKRVYYNLVNKDTGFLVTSKLLDTKNKSAEIDMKKVVVPTVNGVKIDGTYEFVIYAEDLAGNIKEVKKTVKIDNIPPELISYDYSNYGGPLYTTNQTTLKMSVKTKDNTFVNKIFYIIENIEVEVPHSNGNADFVIDLKKLANITINDTQGILIKIEDKLGNAYKTTTPMIWKVDTAPSMLYVDYFPNNVSTINDFVLAVRSFACDDGNGYSCYPDFIGKFHTYLENVYVDVVEDKVQGLTTTINCSVADTYGGQPIFFLCDMTKLPTTFKGTLTVKGSKHVGNQLNEHNDYKGICNKADGEIMPSGYCISNYVTINSNPPKINSYSLNRKYVNGQELNITYSVYNAKTIKCNIVDHLKKDITAPAACSSGAKIAYSSTLPEADYYVKFTVSNDNATSTNYLDFHIDKTPPSISQKLYMELENPNEKFITMHINCSKEESPETCTQNATIEQTGNQPHFITTVQDNNNGLSVKSVVFQGVKRRNRIIGNIVSMPDKTVSPTPQITTKDKNYLKINAVFTPPLGYSEFLSITVCDFSDNCITQKEKVAVQTMQQSTNYHSKDTDKKNPTSGHLANEDLITNYWTNIPKGTKNNGDFLIIPFGYTSMPQLFNEEHNLLLSDISSNPIKSIFVNEWEESILSTDITDTCTDSYNCKICGNLISSYDKAELTSTVVDGKINYTISPPKWHYKKNGKFYYYKFFPGFSYTKIELSNGQIIGPSNQIKWTGINTVVDNLDLKEKVCIQNNLDTK